MIRKEAWLLCRTISSGRLCWELEGPKGPKGSKLLTAAPVSAFQISMCESTLPSTHFAFIWRGFRRFADPCLHSTHETHQRSPHRGCGPSGQARVSISQTTRKLAVQAMALREKRRCFNSCSENATLGLSLRLLCAVGPHHPVTATSLPFGEIATDCSVSVQICHTGERRGLSS